MGGLDEQAAAAGLQLLRDPLETALPDKEERQQHSARVAEHQFHTDTNAKRSNTHAALEIREQQVGIGYCKGWADQVGSTHAQQAQSSGHEAEGASKPGTLVGAVLVPDHFGPAPAHPQDKGESHAAMEAPVGEGETVLGVPVWDAHAAAAAMPTSDKAQRDADEDGSSNDVSALQLVHSHEHAAVPLIGPTSFADLPKLPVQQGSHPLTACSAAHGSLGSKELDDRGDSRPTDDDHAANDLDRGLDNGPHTQAAAGDNMPSDSSMRCLSSS
jgi:hypothetical protein